MKNAIPAGANGKAPPSASGDRLTLRQALFRDQHTYGLIVTDSAGRITDWSPAAERIYGYTREEVLGKTTAMFRRTEEQSELTGRIRKGVERDGYWAGEARIVRKDGTEGFTDTVVFSYVDEHGRLATIGINRDITESKQLENALRESAERLQLITDNVAAVIIYFDAEQRYRFVNDAGVAVLGKPREHIVGRRIADIVGDEFYPTLRPHIERALAGEEVTFEGERPWTGGEPKIFQSTYLPHFDEDGRVIGCYLVSVDITELKRVETEARENETRLRLITDNVAAVIIYVDADERYRFANKAAADIHGRTPDEMIGRTVREVHGDSVYDQIEPYLRAAFDGEEVKFEQERELRDGRRQHYQTTYLPHFDEKGRVVGVYVLLLDVTERKRSEDILRDSERRMRLITDNMPANVIYFDSELHFRFVNKNLEEYYGLPRDEIIGKHASEIQDERMYREVRPQLDRALAGEEVIFEQERKTRDGTPRIYQSIYLPHRDESGAVIGCYALSIDITARSHAESELRENEDLLRLITDNAGAVITYFDRQQRYRFVNKTFADLLGMSREEIIGKTTRQVQGEENYQLSRTYIEAALAGEKATFERRRPGLDGTMRTYHSTYLPHCSERGEIIGVYGISVDITELKSAETVANENEARLRLITDNVGANITYLDREQRYRFINQTFADVLGMSREEVIGRKANELHGADNYRRVQPYLEAALRGEEVTFERSRKGADGVIRHYHSTYLPHYDKNGEVVGTYGLSVDISELKRAQTIAHENEARLRLITDNVGAMIVYFDAEQRYQFVNKAFEGLHGIPAEDLIGRKLPDVIDEAGYEEIRPYIEAALNGEQATFEQVRTLPDGTKHNYHSTFIPHIEDGGAIVGCYALLVDITERVKAERELRENERRLRLITDNMPGHFIYFDSDLIYRFVNKGVEDLFGMAREEVIGKHSRDIQGEATYQRLLPHFERVLAGEHVTFEQRRTAVDGVTRDYETSYLPHFADDGRVVGCYIMSFDITERKRAEAELQQKTRAAELLRKIAVAANHADSPDAAIQVSLDEICAFSEWPIGHAYLLSGSGDGELVSTNLWHLDDPRQFEPFRRITESTVFQPGVGLPGLVVATSSSYWLSEADDSDRYPRAAVAKSAGIETGFAIPVLVGHQVAAVLEFFTGEVIARDDSLLSIAEQVGVLIGRVIERQRTEQNLLTAKEEAELASRAKTEFLANMSHELRTPLNAIIGFSDIINNDTLDETSIETLREYASHINESGQHLLTLINDVLDISMIESGTAVLHEERNDVAAIVHACITMVGERARSGKLRLEVEMPEAPLPDLHADGRRIKQILINLLSNAVKFTKPGGSVALKVWSDSDGYVFQVRDTGIGIEPEDIPKALARFQQVESSLNRKYGGTGLGLSLAKAMAEQHDGTLDLESQPGIGTTVTVRLPTARILPPHGRG